MFLIPLLIIAAVIFLVGKKIGRHQHGYAFEHGHHQHFRGRHCGKFQAKQRRGGGETRHINIDEPLKAVSLFDYDEPTDKV